MHLNVKFSNNRQGIALLGTIFLVLFLSIFIGAVALRSVMQLKQVDSRTDKQYAYYAAEAGIERAVFELRSNIAWRPDPKADKNVPIKIVDGGVEKILGFYSLEFADGDIFEKQWDTLWIRSSGMDVFNNAPRTIDARIIVASTARFLISTQGTLKILSGTSINDDILGQDVIFQVDEAEQDPDKKKINVNGTVFYIRSVTGHDNPAVKFPPPPNDKPIKAPSITFAGVDVVRYRNLAQSLAQSQEGIYQNGNLTVNLSSFDGQGEPIPQIIFAEGDIHISGEYSASMLIVAKGNLYIDDNVTFTDNAPNGGSHPQIGLFSDQDVLISLSAPNDLTVQAFIVADGDGGNTKGIFKAEGPKYTKGKLTINGAISVRGRPGINPNESVIDLNVYTQRAYSFDESLSSNPTIPFTIFIANIIDWREVEPSDPFPPQ